MQSDSKVRRTARKVEGASRQGEVRGRSHHNIIDKTEIWVQANGIAFGKPERVQGSFEWEKPMQAATWSSG